MNGMKTTSGAENTRLRILKAAFKEMHRHGFQGMRIDRVLLDTGLKKGALYYHFQSKQALGLAVLEELIEQSIRQSWIVPLQKFDDPVTGIDTLLSRLEHAWDDEFFFLGCPLNNLALEMSPIDEVFKKRIQEVFQHWRQALADAFLRGQKNRIIDPGVDAAECAMFVIAALEGLLGMTRNQQNKTVYTQGRRELSRYLNALRVTRAE